MARMLNLSISKRMILFITVPLVIESIFFGVLLQQFQNLQQELKKEAEAVDTLVLVNRIFVGAMSGAGNLFSSTAFRQPKLYEQAMKDFDEVDRHILELKRIAPADGESATSGFVKIIEQAKQMFEDTATDAHEDEFRVENFKMAGKAKSFLKRLQVAGLRVIEEKTRYRDEVRENTQLIRGKIELIIQTGIAINFVFAIIAIIAFGMTLGKRFRVVFDNTMRIAANQPLNPPLKGGDELSRLDHIIHQMDEELQVTRLRERAIIDNTAEIICSLDQSCRVVEVNSAVQKRLGYPEEDFRGSIFQSHVVTEQRQIAYDSLQKSRNAGKEYSFETQLVTRDGGVRDVEVTAQWSETNQGIFCILRDITARKESERLKAEVIAMVSHDLRAPLTSIGMSLDMIVDGIFGEINDRGMKVASAAQQSVTSLIAMINDLLDIERAESTGVQLYYEETDCAKVVARALEVVKPEADSKKIALAENSVSQDCKFDVERINRVLVNLLNNAIKFSPSGSKITVSCNRIGDKLEFSVSDQGAGIPEDKIDSVFEKFRQVGTGSEGEKKGSGLGLAICKTMVEAHGGNIGVKSVLGQGSTFWFTVPVNPPLNPSSQSEG
ncbi:MAG: PAS domain-containing sensor histidine kinase [Candidatus Obscuribacterales bacterium]|nr:PAS domain S-box protein [Cyanobacteria bacterium SZAS LIN-5]